MINNAFAGEKFEFTFQQVKSQGSPRVEPYAERSLDYQMIKREKKEQNLTFMSFSLIRHYQHYA
jgi:hypothetical protein